MSHRNHCILIVEDQEDDRKILRDFLTSKGFAQVEATTGEEGVRLARARSGRIDLLVSDVVMPGMCGCDTARVVQKLHPETQAIFISGYPAKARSAAAGARLLYKPFSRAVLAEKVREV